MMTPEQITADIADLDTRIEVLSAELATLATGSPTETGAAAWNEAYAQRQELYIERRTLKRVLAC